MNEQESKAPEKTAADDTRNKYQFRKARIEEESKELAAGARSKYEEMRRKGSRLIGRAKDEYEHRRYYINARRNELEQEARDKYDSLRTAGRNIKEEAKEGYKDIHNEIKSVFTKTEDKLEE